MIVPQVGYPVNTGSIKPSSPVENDRLVMAPFLRGSVCMYNYTTHADKRAAIKPQNSTLYASSNDDILNSVATWLLEQ